MFDVVKSIELLVSDPYGFLFILIFVLFVILTIFKKLTKLFMGILFLIAIYLLVMYFRGVPAPEISDKIKAPLSKEINQVRKWSKNMIWEKSDSLNRSDGI